MNDDLERNVAGIGTLADPVRRRLYRYVCAQAHPVSRDQAAEAVGIARHQAKFHLDRLEAEGLLDTDYVRHHAAALGLADPLDEVLSGDA